MSWPGERQRHMMSARGISTTLARTITVEPENTEHARDHFTKTIKKLQELEKQHDIIFVDFDITNYQIDYEDYDLGIMHGTLLFGNSVYKIEVSSSADKDSHIIGFFAEEDNNPDIPETQYEFFDFLEHLSKWKGHERQPLGKYGNLEMVSNVKITIKTPQGDAYYVGSETEDEQGKWSQNYQTNSGEYVIHQDKEHHVYITDRVQAGVLEL